MKRLLTGERALSCVVIICLSFIALLLCLLFSIVPLFYLMHSRWAESNYTTGIADSNNSDGFSSTITFTL